MAKKIALDYALEKIKRLEKEIVQLKQDKVKIKKDALVLFHAKNEEIERLQLERR